LRNLLLIIFRDVDADTDIPRSRYIIVFNLDGVVEGNMLLRFKPFIVCIRRTLLNEILDFFYILNVDNGATLRRPRNR
jgi:hypothetical protein